MAAPGNDARSGDTVTRPGERTSIVAVALALGALALVLVAGPADGQPVPLRTAWGAPDLNGVWNHGTATPLERPERHAGRERLSDAEVAEVNAEARSAEGVGARRTVWWERGLSDGRTSMIVDPSNGRIPYTPEAAATSRPSRTDGPEDLPLQARCLSYGVPRLGGPYSQNIHLFQTPGYVVLLHEMIHEFRIVPLDNRSHVPSNVRQWMGDSRARWEGDTLVVDTTNFSAQQLFRGRSMASTRLVERFTRLDAETLRYTVTFEDPDTWSQPWTASLAMAQTEGAMFEFACHEGNYGMTGILEIARGEDVAAAGVGAR